MTPHFKALCILISKTIPKIRFSGSDSAGNLENRSKHQVTPHFISPYIKCVGCNACSRDWQHVTWWVIPVFLRLLMGVLVVLVLFYFVHCVTRTKQKTIENFVCRKRKYGTEFKYQFFRLYFLFQIACNCVQIIKSSVQCIFVAKVEEFPGQSPGLPLVLIYITTTTGDKNLAALVARVGRLRLGAQVPKKIRSTAP